MNPKHQGECSEAKILARVLELGFSASLPFGNNQRYDLVLDDGKVLQRAQCKTAWVKDGALVFSVTSKNGFTGKRSGYGGQIEIFLVYSPANWKVYRIPVGVATSNEMRLRIEGVSSNAPKTKIRWARDFEF